MSKSNFSKAMKELIGINDEDLEKDGDEEIVSNGNPLDNSLMFGKEDKMDFGTNSLTSNEESDFDKERDDAAAKLRMMLNKDKESEKKETPTSSFADKFTKMAEVEKKADVIEEFIVEEKIVPTVETIETPVAATSKPSLGLASVSKTTDSNITPADAKTVIGKGVVITGSLTAQGDVEVNGIIKGDIKTMGNVTVKGKVAGDVGSTDLNLVSGGAVQGDIMARGTASIAKDSVIIGDITAGNINLNGKVKGNLAARDVADLSDTSVIDGNITAASVAINPGTKLRGQISLTSASDVNDDDFVIDFES